MVVTRLRLRGVRSYERADVTLGPGLTVVHGRNGAGKTNLLEGLYFGCTGRSCRTTNEREFVAFDAGAARVEVDCVDDRGDEHTLAVGFSPGEAKRYTADGAPVERLVDVEARPLVSVFLPDRLELVKGPPAGRRAHLDQFVTGLWPARAANRSAYRQALAQRNALLARVRAGRADRAQLASWNAALAPAALALRDDRAAAVDLVVARVAELAAELGMTGRVELRYRPRTKAATPEEFAAELAERTDSDVERGFTGHGPHRDDVVLLRDGRELRAYGSQGEQRLALLALLIAERDALAEQRAGVPLLLLDDVMSELDADRRRLLVERVSAQGQCLITTTDLAHVPGAEAGDAAGASELYAHVLELEPDNIAAIAGLAKLHLDLGDLEGATGILGMVPEAKAADPAVAAVRAAIELAQQAASLGDTAELEAKVAANPKDHQARFDLALALNARDRREEAVDHLIAIIKADRAWNEDGARKQLLQFFEAWGPMDEHSMAGRRKLSTLLFS